MTDFTGARQLFYSRPRLKDQSEDLQRVLGRAYRRFSERYPEWAASLFDEYFLTCGKGALIDTSDKESRLPEASSLAAAWADQLWYQEETMQALVAELTPVAAEFLQLAEAELRIQASLRGIPPGPAKEERRRKVHW